MASANSTRVTVVTADPAFEAAMRATFGASNAIDLTIVSGSLPEHADTLDRDGRDRASSSTSTPPWRRRWRRWRG